MNIKLTRAPKSFLYLAVSHDNKVRMKILVTTIFITQVKLKPLIFYLMPMYCL
jgi:hypothetical protein